MCCNYYFDDKCMITCPDNSSTNATSHDPFDCTCDPGFVLVDSLCDYDECSAPDYPCQQDQGCINTKGSYVCSVCNESTSPCMNGGMCLQVNESLECICPPTHTGALCEIDINECDTEPDVCQNDGVCNNIEGGFECSCSPSYTGPTCDVKGK